MKLLLLLFIALIQCQQQLSFVNGVVIENQQFAGVDCSLVIDSCNNIVVRNVTFRNCIAGVDGIIPITVKVST